jgi:hypothetical protein
MLLNEFLKAQPKGGRTGRDYRADEEQIETLTAIVLKARDQVALSKPAPLLVANP